MSGRTSAIYAIIPDENKIRMINGIIYILYYIDIAGVPLSLLLFHIGIEEGEKCTGKVIFAGTSCAQQAKILLEKLRISEVNIVYFIASLTPVSQTCWKVMEYIFKENGIGIVGSIDILGTELEDGMAVGQAILGSEEDDQFSIINLAEGKYYPAIIYGLEFHNLMIDFNVYNTFINEYDINEIDTTNFDSYNQYFVPVFYNDIGGNLVKDIRNKVTSRIGRTNDFYITSNFFIIHSLIELYVKAITYSASADPKHYQKYLLLLIIIIIPLDFYMIIQLSMKMIFIYFLQTIMQIHNYIY